MATYDRDRGEVVLRIVYDGLALVGKTENLRSLERSFSDRINVALESPMLTSSGRTQFFDWLELDVGFIDETPARCQVLSVPGQLALVERRVFLLRRADAVVFVCESTEAGARAARRAFRSLARALTSVERAIPIVLQANMQDRADALTPRQVAAILGVEPALAADADPRAPAAAVLGAAALTDDGVRPSFLVALAAARQLARDELARDGLEQLAVPDASPQALMEAMRTADAEHDAIVQATLDVALEE